MWYYTSYLHNTINYMRTNIYKDKILNILQENHLLSISDINKKIGSADYSTVYRNIKSLTLENNIKKVVFGKHRVMYEIMNPSNQHDHFLCIDCGDIEEMQISARKINLPARYKITDVVAKGFCGKCN